jgi:hypothetical protein
MMSGVAAIRVIHRMTTSVGYALALRAEMRRDETDIHRWETRNYGEQADGNTCHTPDTPHSYERTRWWTIPVFKYRWEHCSSVVAEFHGTNTPCRRQRPRSMNTSQSIETYFCFPGSLNRHLQPTTRERVGHFPRFVYKTLLISIQQGIDSYSTSSNYCSCNDTPSNNIT